MRTALIFGSTGLVGSYLLKELISREDYSNVKSFVRQPSGFSHPKLTEYVIDFDNLSKHSDVFTGDDVYICLGTTIKKAGSISRMENIDRDYPIEIARFCLKNGVNQVAVVSSIGTNSKSKNYYLRIKGEMEEGIRKLEFQKTAIARPSMLLGQRKEFRMAEKIGKVIIVPFGYLLFGKLKKYKSIHGRTVAKAMIKILTQNIPGTVFESDELEQLGTS